MCLHLFYAATAQLKENYNLILLQCTGTELDTEDVADLVAEFPDMADLQKPTSHPCICTVEQALDNVTGLVEQIGPSGSEVSACNPHKCT